MGKLQKFVIEFERIDDSGIYVAGQLVKGNVCVHLSEPMDIRGIYIKLWGEASVKWTEYYDKIVVVYHKTESIFDERQNLIGSDNEKMTLADGQHCFPFSYVIPHDVPSSLDVDHGKIRYTAEATIKRPWAFDEHTRCHFSVTGILDLNSSCYAELVEPITAEIQKEVSSLFKSGKVSVKVTISRGCFVAGETCLMQAEIFNESNCKMHKVWASIKQYVVLRAQKTRKRSKAVHTVVRQETILPGAVANWLNVPVTIPAIPPTNLAGQCSIINLTYALKFYTDSGLKLSIPLVIGTVPVSYSAAALNCWRPPMPLPDLPPPSYDEANNDSKAVLDIDTERTLQQKH